MSLPTGGIATAAVEGGAASSMGPGPGGEAEPRSRAVAGEAVEGGAELGPSSFLFGQLGHQPKQWHRLPANTMGLLSV